MDGPKHDRKAIRFPLDAPIVFWWADRGIDKKGEGRTLDISEMGAFVLASTCPPAGTHIGFEVLLPMLPGFKPRTRVEALGQVLRVEKARGPGGRDGFAILTRHTLLRVNNDMQGQGNSSANEPQLN
jgi:hypothetical protein